MIPGRFTRRRLRRRSQRYLKAEAPIHSPSTMQEAHTTNHAGTWHDAEKLYFDVPRLRSAYPSHFLSAGIAYAFHPHRDLVPAPMCQLNWWIPIYPPDPNSAMGFYPRYFDEAVRNNSKSTTTTNGTRRAAQPPRSTSRAIHASSRRRSRSSIRHRALSSPPGGIIVFSVPSCTRQCPTPPISRYSIDFRTVITTTSCSVARNVDSLHGGRPCVTISAPRSEPPPRRGNCALR